MHSRLVQCLDRMTGAFALQPLSRHVASGPGWASLDEGTWPCGSPEQCPTVNGYEELVAVITNCFDGIFTNIFVAMPSARSLKCVCNVARGNGRCRLGLLLRYEPDLDLHHYVWAEELKELPHGEPPVARTLRLRLGATTCASASAPQPAPPPRRHVGRVHSAEQGARHERHVCEGCHSQVPHPLLSSTPNRPATRPFASRAVIVPLGLRGQEQPRATA